MSKEREHLIEIFSQLARAYHLCGERYINSELDAFVGQLISEEFFALPAEQQRSHLAWYGEAYVGRGQLLLGFIGRGILRNDFGADMQTSIFEYLLTTDLPVESKQAMANHLARLSRDESKNDDH